MCEVNFFDPRAISDHLLRFAVIVASYQGKYVFCRHRLRSTWEIPGGHREKDEAIDETARRELREETGAEKAMIRPVSVYGVKDGDNETYGMLFFATIEELTPLSDSYEIAEITFCDSLPTDLTYPLIQPRLFEHVLSNANKIDEITRLQRIRNAESKSHMQMYSEYDLFTPGSWLAHPVKTVMETLSYFQSYSSVRVLDLGCGVGRNSIPIAKTFSNIPCIVDCVDILPYAIDRLLQNASAHGVMQSICGTVSSIEDFPIRPNAYDLVVAVSALEHVCSAEAFCRKLDELREGMCSGGIFCLIISTDISEIDQDTGESLPPQFEINFTASELNKLLHTFFFDCTFLKESNTRQKYVIPRDQKHALLCSLVNTYIIKKERQTE